MQSGTHRSKQTYNIEEYYDPMSGDMVRVIETVTNMTHAVLSKAEFDRTFEKYVPQTVTA
jgi:hypothetical protein